MLSGIDALVLARAQFGFTVAFHIVFPAFSIGLASYLAVLEALWLWTGRQVFMDLFRYWLKIFAMAFAMGVVSGLVMSYQFGTNWSVYADKTGPVLGPMMAYEVLSAFFIKAGFLGVMLFGMNKVGPRLHFLASLMVAVGTFFSAFWILAVNSWMQTPAGYGINAQGQFVPEDWWAIVFNPSFPYRLIHMVLAAYLTTALVVGAVGAWHLIAARRGDPRERHEGARVMFSMAMWMAALVAPVQIAAGDAHGLNTLVHQPMKIAAMEGDYETRKGGAPLILFGLPDQATGTIRDALEIPHLSSVILTHTWSGEVKGLDTVPRADWPEVPIVFFTFRIMVGLGFLIVGLGLASLLARWKGRLYDWPWLHRFALLMGPAGFVALLCGWITTEVGRQPYTIYGLLRTADSASPLEAPAVAASLIAFVVIYFTVFSVGVWYILRLMARPPLPHEPGVEEGAPIRTAGITPVPAVHPDRTLNPAE